MTPQEAVVRLRAAENGARSAYDGTFANASDLADPYEVYSAQDEVSAMALQAEFLVLAEAMQELDVDAETVGQALDMVAIMAVVAEAARWVRTAEAMFAGALERRAAANRLPVRDPCDGCHDHKAAAVADAQRAVTQAAGFLGMKQGWLQEVLGIAADLAAAMRAGLYRRHGDIKEATDSAPVRAAVREFYEPA